ncbi:GNAT family N-acetyltransferase [Vibrio sp. WXL103]|uniref:GNAT family N-acetyltransferase n=1 Tax=Vibrio sp. WXL103 TaxID=3450710 RepID=UPI003EC77D1C
MRPNPSIEWHCYHFDQLSTQLLYQILKLRVDVFIVEQNCPYPELDDKDTQAESIHLVGLIDGDLAAYCRVLAANISYSSPSIGRVVVSQAARQMKLGHQLIERAVQLCEQSWPAIKTIEIGAQQHLERFYAQHGFIASSEMYLEDGIPHIDMLRRRPV